MCRSKGGADSGGVAVSDVGHWVGPIGLVVGGRPRQRRASLWRVTTPSDLDPQDYMTFLIGKTARLDVQLEAIAREVWRALAGPRGLAKHAAPSRLVPALEGVLGMLAAGDFEPRLVDGATRAIKDARAAHERRNIVVHEGWAHEESGVWSRGNDYLTRGTKPGWKLEDFEACSIELSRSGERLLSVLYLVKSSYPRDDLLLRESDFRILEGRFILTQDAVRVEGLADVLLKPTEQTK